jgi:hypothetical protein
LPNNGLNDTYRSPILTFLFRSGALRATGALRFGNDDLGRMTLARICGA